MEILEQFLRVWYLLYNFYLYSKLLIILGVLSKKKDCIKEK